MRSELIASRKDIFVTTKLHPRDHGFDSTRQRGTDSTTVEILIGSAIVLGPILLLLILENV